MRVKFAKTEEEANEYLTKGWEILSVLPGPVVVLKLDNGKAVDDIMSRVSWKKFSDGSGEWAYVNDATGKPIPETARAIELVSRNNVINGMKYTIEKDGKYLVRRKA